ncbi:unnamed protein product [Strongylus vulgaris]|uniref:Uncharacterized protein n=1 Tax=Strongylus vulgaris TaxID=40348 RepID=A0A3P7ISN5_STRVU|nr:unnamed protein product [Strongylus vulgaris]
MSNALKFRIITEHFQLGFGDTARTYNRLVDALYDVISPLN